MLSDALGVNEILIEALCPAANVTGVVMPLAWKSVALTEICETVTLVFPLLVMVTLFELELPALTLLKPTLAGAAESVTDAAVPVPLKAKTFGELGALLVMLTVPLKLPAAAGANRTLNVTALPAATVAGVANPLTLYPFPFTESCAIVSANVPVFVTVTD
jgi:hypothetical protein